MMSDRIKLAKEKDMEKVEYKISPVQRFVITRYHTGSNGAGIKECGEFDDETQAKRVARALKYLQSKDRPDD